MSELCRWIRVRRSHLILRHWASCLRRCPKVLLLWRRLMVLLRLRLRCRHCSLLELLWKLSGQLHPFFCLLHQLHCNQEHRFCEMVFSIWIRQLPNLFTSFPWKLSSSNELLHLHVWNSAGITLIHAVEDVLEFAEVVDADGERTVVLLALILTGLLFFTLHQLRSKTFQPGQLHFQIHLYWVFISLHSILLVGNQTQSDIELISCQICCRCFSRLHPYAFQLVWRQPRLRQERNSSRSTHSIFTLWICFAQQPSIICPFRFSQLESSILTLTIACRIWRIEIEKICHLV